MKPRNKKKWKTIQDRPTHKTKEDFLRWLKEKKTLKNQTAKEKTTQTSRADLWALMIWADDGGAVI